MRCGTLLGRDMTLDSLLGACDAVFLGLGLALGEPPPPLHSRQAAEVTRRVIEWARGPVVAT